MIDIYAYTDGSFNEDDGRVHGGILYLSKEQDVLGTFHLVSSKPSLVSMRNIGGELLAAKYAIEGCIDNCRSIEEGLHLELCYDYAGIGNWITGEYRAKKSDTIEYANSINKLLEENKDKFYLTLCQVAGHSGVVGNEVVDKIAFWDMAFCKEHNIKIIEL